jgi:tetratricopeptide (TPR) repeat protein
MVLGRAPWWSFAIVTVLLVIVGATSVNELLENLLLPRWARRALRRTLGGPDRVAPAELPPPVVPFVGRSSNISQMLGYLHDRQGQSPRLIVISGPPGIGKTALATTFAYQVANMYPDGQLFASLNDAAGRHPPTMSVLAGFILAIQRPGEPAPETANDRATRYRELTREGQFLIVLDDIRDVEQAETLLPRNRSCAVIATSRVPVVLASDQCDVKLEALNINDGLELLDAMVGDGRVGREYSAAEKIVESSAGYPLAIRLAGSSLATRHYLGLQLAVTRMNEEENRFGTTGNAAKLPGFLDMTYTMLTENERNALRSLGLIDEPVFEPWMLAALDDIDIAAAVKLTAGLARAGLIRAVSEDPAAASLFRVDEHVLNYAKARLNAETDPEEARAMSRRLTDEGLSRLKSIPSHTLRNNVFIWQDQGKFAEAMNAARDSLARATRQENKAAVGLALASLAELYLELGQLNDAEDLANEAKSLEGSEMAGAHSRALRCIGKINWRLRQTDAAQENLGRALRIACDIDDQAEQVRILRELAAAHAQSVAPAQGIEMVDRAMAICHARRDGGKRLLPGLLWAAGLVLLSDDRLDEAASKVMRASEISGETGQVLWTAWSLQCRGDIALRAGDHNAARKYAIDALEMFTEMRHRYGAAHCRLIIGETFGLDQRTDESAREFETALETFQNCGDPWITAESLRLLALAKRDQKHMANETAQLLENSYRIFEDLGDARSMMRVRKELSAYDMRWRRLAWAAESLVGVTPAAARS